MELDTYRYLQQKEELWKFVRLHPEWYRYLTREPARVAELEVMAKQYYGKTLPQRMERVQQNMQMIQLLMQMAGSWND
ncbi:MULTISPECIES: YlbE-like family protein [Gracilibacillus]|uniref:YlbE-like family protein n=1 Tax=Gracilibacillus TaxID=74385 RepID=UPI000825CA90|nr:MULTISPECIES: YlbE-like family protein [Gracilibacillus]